MKHKPRSEMSKMLWNFTIPILLLVALIVAAYLIYGVANSNNNAKRTKKLLIDQSVQSYKSLSKSWQDMKSLSPELLKQFNPDIIKVAYSGNPEPLYKLTKNIMSLTIPNEYIAIIVDGKVIDYTASSGVVVDPSKLPNSAPSSKYVMLDNFGGQKGTFVDIFSTVDLTTIGIKAKFAVSFIIDMTEQVKEIDKYFHDQKRNTVLGLVITGIVALILFGLLSTFWLRYLINKFVRKPVEELNAIAQDLAAGTYEGEVVVDENSDFAALQGLLRSGQLILRRFNEKMGDQD